MALAVRRTYACPTCSESFTKWSLCQSHVHGSAPCRAALGEKLRNLDQLQELCRAAACGPEAAIPGIHLGSGDGYGYVQDVPGMAAWHADTEKPSSLSAAAAPFVPGMANAEIPQNPALMAPYANGNMATANGTSATASAAFIGTKNGLPIARPLYTAVAPPPPPPLPSGATKGEGPSRLCSSVVQKLERTVQNGYLLEAEKRRMDEKLDILADLPEAMQIAVVTKFLSPSFGDFRWISDKAVWLQRCLKFCIRTSSSIAQGPSSAEPSSPSGALVAALASHGLLPDALAQECWSTFDLLPAQLQNNVVTAVRHSLIMSIGSKPSEHFVHLCVNEEVIYNLEAKPPPYVSSLPAPVEWEAIDGTLYQRLLQQMLFRRRNAEEKLLHMLAEDCSEAQPGEPGSLLHVHLATHRARQRGSAEVLSLLHAAAASGLSRLCARFLAEGLNINEAAGHQEVTPLHLAAANSSLEVVQLLLRRRANPTLFDAECHSPIHSAVTSAALQLDTGDALADAASQQQLQFKVSQELLMGCLKSEAEGILWDDRENADLEVLAEQRELWQLRNLLRLHSRLRDLQRRLPLAVSDVALSEICELQYETASFVIALFESHVNVNDEAAPIEFRSVLASDFIQTRDRVQRLGNRLAKRIGLSRRAIDMLLNMPPQAALYALESWKLEEIVEGVFEIPRQDSPPPEAEEEELPQAKNETVEDAAPEVNRLTGVVRKWDSDRGFGFIVQDLRESDDPLKDIFVHRTNLKGICPGSHFDLREGSRVSYLIGIQDGKPRAMEVAMMDGEGRILNCHLLPGQATTTEKQSQRDKKKGLIADLIEEEQDEMSKKFMQHLQGKEVQEVCKERRPECEAWLRCVGLRRHNSGRRDDVLWKKEIEKRVDVFLEQKTTPLQKRDFDFRVRRFLNEFCMHSTVARVSEALSMVAKSTAGKTRDDVRSWPAYLATLLRHFDPDVYLSLADRDRKSRTDQRRPKQAGKDGLADSIDDGMSPLGQGPREDFGDHGENSEPESELEGGIPSVPSSPREAGQGDPRAPPAASSFAFQ
eukprot:TRINITY_DN13537_c0_g1_i1.p1 TRINITY_DN13537_c0_g1~~TRINITY_DN13537_c0_g1_i1.p1  ORF type:complete len:1047 (+),score=207.07 TRINITY_DN13537_c0_g1_i1:58-3198(+)